MVFINKLTSNPKKLFLIDGLGAFLTASLLFSLLSKFEEYFGMPKMVIYYLSFVALLFSLYSFCCYFFISKNWKPYLKIIAIANTLYCIFTFGLAVYFYEQLTFLGLLYFLLEVIVIISLVYTEKIALTNNTDRVS